MRIALSAALALTLAVPVAAQQARPASRWLPFIGCWEREPAMVMPPAVRLTCILPTELPAAVDFVTVADGHAIASERITIGEGDQALDREGCRGTERAAFSDHPGRIFRTFEAHCQAGIARTASQLMVVLPGYGWADVQVMSVLGTHARRVFRYYEPDRLDVPDDILARFNGLLPVAHVARAAISESIGIKDVTEATRQVGSDAVQAWLLNAGRGISVGGRELLAARRAGLPDEVIDIMVALSYPERFRIGDSSGVALLEGSDGGGYAGYGVGAAAMDYTLSYCDGCPRYGYDPLSFVDYGYSSYDTGSYVVPIVMPGGNGAAPHGRVVNGAGYSAGAGAVSAREAHPSGDGTGTTPSSGGSSTGATSSGTSGGVSASSTGNPGSTTVRTAKPRP